MNVFQFHRISGRRVAIVGALCTLTAVTQTVTFAQDWPGAQPFVQAGNSSVTQNPDPNVAQAEAEVYWTPQRLVSAVPLDLQPAVGANGLPVGPQAAADPSPAVRGESGLPSAALNLQDVKTLIPDVFLNSAPKAEPIDSISPNATSSFGANFTTYRVFPDAATTAYPNLTAGKLFFRDPRTGGNFVCSASTLQRRLVVTAGHCVTRASTNAALRYFYTNFLFVPAFRNGIGPVGTWTPSIVWVTNTWFHSNGSVPNAQDVGMLVMNDRNGSRIGHVTGWLGFLTNQLGRNHSTMLGYPCNLDSCQRMQINHAQTFANGGNNTFIYGSAMRGGSSGGPWIQDYGVEPEGAPAGLLANNYLIAVTSYGPVATGPKYQGASNLDSRFISLKNAACGAANSGNCN